MVKRKSKEIEELRHKSRRYSIKEGILSSIKRAFGDHYIQPFAIAINSSNFIVAFLSSISGLLGPLSQMFGSQLMEKHSRKKIVAKAVFLESLIWIPMIILAVLFYKGIAVGILPMVLLLTFSVYIIFCDIGTPAWFSWIGDLVDSEYRGRWFSKRNIIVSFVSGILAVIASFALDFLNKKGLLMIGFIILFSFAFLARVYCYRIFKKQYEPKIKLKKRDYFSFWQFIKKSPQTNFGRFTIFRGLFNFATGISSALLAIYLLRELNFSYSVYMIVSLAGGIFSILTIRLWGKFSDNYGNYKVLYITSFLIPIVPVLWVLHPSPLYLILIPSMISGIAWAGFNLSSGNFIYDCVRPEKRGFVISYFNMILGIGTFIGAGFGALLIKYLHTSMHPIVLIFIISAAARLIIALILIPEIKEIRKTEKFEGKKVLRNLVFKNAKATLSEEFHEILSIKEYLKEK